MSSDLAALLAAAAGAAPSVDAEAAARRYDAAALRTSEERRELERQARVAELTARFIDGPVVTFPRGFQLVTAARKLDPAVSPRSCMTKS